MTGYVLAVGDLVGEMRANVADLPLDEPVGWAVVVLTGLAVVVGPWVMVIGTRQVRFGYRMFTNDPVGAGEAHLQDGVVEVEGVVEPLEETVTGPYTGETAVAYTCRRERREERTDDDGETTTSWETVSRDSDAVPFLVADETGEVAVDPAGANLSITEAEVTRGGSTSRRRPEYQEYEGRIEPGEDVHVYGQLRTAADGEGAPGEERTYVGDGDEVSEFVVSDGSELRTVLRYVGTGLFLVVVASLWIPLATLLFLVMLEGAVGVQVLSALVGFR